MRLIGLYFAGALALTLGYENAFPDDLKMPGISGIFTALREFNIRASIQRGRANKEAIFRCVSYLCNFCAYCVSLSVLACLVFPGLFAPLLGHVLLPPRSAKQPQLPYGLSLVDTTDTERPKTVEYAHQSLTFLAPFI
jgi:hypothetical protein